MRKWRFILVLTALFLLFNCSSQAVNGVNIIQNSSFNSGVYGWSITGGVTAVSDKDGGLIIPVPQGLDGNMIARALRSGATIKQSIPVHKNAVYKIRFLLNSNGSTFYKLSQTGYTPTQVNFGSTSKKWTEATGFYIETENISERSFTLQCNYGSSVDSTTSAVMWDDISVREVNTLDPVFNQSFEEGFADWGYFINSTVFSISHMDVRAGGSSLKIEGDGVNSSLTQDIVVNSNTDYQLEYWVKGTGTGTSINIKGNMLNKSFFVSGVENEWRRYITPVFHSGTDTVLSVAVVSSGSDSISLDDIRVTVPENISSVIFTDESGRQLSAASSATRMNVSVCLNNSSGKQQNIHAVYGLYTLDNILCDMKIIPVVIPEGETYNFIEKFSLPLKTVSGFTAKIFFWEDITNIKPVFNPSEFSGNLSFTERMINNYIKEIAQGVYEIQPSDAVYVEGGSSADLNMLLNEELRIKYNPYVQENDRKSYLKFDMTELPTGSITTARLKLYNTRLENNEAQTIRLAEVSDDSWSDKLITYNTAPASEGLITSVYISPELQTKLYEADITGYIRQEASRDNKASIALLPDTSKIRYCCFAAKGDMYPPKLIVCLDNAVIPTETTYTDPLKTYPLELQVNTTSPWVTYLSKNISTITGFTPYNSLIRESDFGGRTDRTANATGYFYVKKTDGRWWMVDPTGYYYINNAVGVVAPGTDSTDPVTKNAYRDKFNSDKAIWSGYTYSMLKNNGFRGIGAWSNYSDYMRSTIYNAPLIPDTSIVYMLRTYARSKGMETEAGGSTGLYKNIMPVFDDEFAAMCEQIAAEQIQPLKNDQYRIGWLTDNELPVATDMLYNTLTINVDNYPEYSISYNVAWQWFVDRKGENADIYDITYDDKEAYLGFVYDKYYEVTTEAVRKYDSNHMCLGSRLLTKAIDMKSVIGAAGKYLDAVSINFYGNFDYTAVRLQKLERWAGKPFIATEFYTKSASDSATDSGAGWIAKSRLDEGLWYQNLTLQFLDSRACVGWHYFPFQSQSSGIIDAAYEPRTDMTDKMKQLNENIYQYIDFTNK